MDDDDRELLKAVRDLLAEALPILHEAKAALARYEERIPGPVRNWAERRAARR